VDGEEYKRTFNIWTSINHTQVATPSVLFSTQVYTRLETSGPEIHGGTATYQRTDSCESLETRICTSVRVNEKVITGR